MDNRIEWTKKHDEVVRAVENLGFPSELGNQISRQLGSPKAMERMISYLREVKPRKAEFVVDEMLAICEEIAEWRKRKESQEANARINENYASFYRDQL